MDLRGLDHVGVVVDDLEEAARLLEALGLIEHERKEHDGLRLAFFTAGNAMVEIIEPTDPEVRARRLGEARARIEHIALEIGDLERTLQELAALGVEPNAPPRPTMFWTDPDTSDGIMFQFVQR
ncbi:MAG TPA: VOC family protein [Solirubrobacter sp.]|nr:VOC family protein [Solirubrobacter sp.]